MQVSRAVVVWNGYEMISQPACLPDMKFKPKYNKLENVFMKHYAPNHMLAPKKGSSQKGVQLKP